VFPNFKNGGQAGLGVQYNINPSLSVGLNAGTSVSIKYVDPLPLSSAVGSIGDDNYKSRFANFSIGTDFRYKFLAAKKFSPYVYGEVNVNFYSARVQPHYTYINQNKPYDPYDPNGIDSKYTIARYNAREVSSVAMGVTGGVGFDLKISNTFVLFLQSGYNIKFTQGNETMLKNLNFININTGLRFSLFKSKSLL
ncbi:MAG: outer membrane beta-barrel protein, partial [Cytophagaceae bacterium]